MSWSDLLARPDVRETAVDAGPIGVMAIHGGLEAGTAELAARIATLAGCGLYTLEQPAELRWHVASHAADPDDAGALGRWLRGVRRVLSLHGYGRPGRHREVLVGGGAADLASATAEWLTAHLRPSADLVFVHDVSLIPSALRGRHPRNPVNRPAGGGVQLELPVAARSGVPAEALAEAAASLLVEWSAPSGAASGFGAGAQVGPGSTGSPVTVSNVPPARQ